MMYTERELEIDFKYDQDNILEARGIRIACI